MGGWGVVVREPARGGEGGGKGGGGDGGRCGPPCSMPVPEIGFRGCHFFAPFAEPQGEN